MPNTISIESLSLAAIDTKSRYFDFGIGFGETWEAVYPTLLVCPYCQDTFDDDEHMEGDPCPDAECYNMHEHELERPECSPAMNYHYALPYYGGSPERDQTILYQSSANVVLVKIMDDEDDENAYALALSGGGMDLSFDICHAYILLGYAPPIHFTDLPDFAGQDNRREPFASIIKACLQSVESVTQRANRKKEKLVAAQYWTDRAE